MTPDAQALCFFIAFAAFVVAAVLYAVRPTRAAWLAPVLVAGGLAAWVFVNFWVAVHA